MSEDPPAQKSSIDAEVAHNEAGLERSAPELLEGRLPAELERRLQAIAPDGFIDYALGTHQGRAVTLAEAASERIAMRVLGIEQDPHNRFLLFCAADFPEYAKLIRQAVAQGYYGPDLGRFVYAFPVHQKDLNELGGNANARHVVDGPTFYAEKGGALAPTDFFIEDEAHTHKYTNPKYCAGFIDTDGIFHTNSSFMQQAEFTSENPDHAVAAARKILEQ